MTPLQKELYQKISTIDGVSPTVAIQAAKAAEWVVNDNLREQKKRALKICETEEYRANTWLGYVDRGITNISRQIRSL